MQKTLRPLLLLAYHFRPSSESGAARPSRWFNYLPEWGYQPYVVTPAKNEHTPFVRTVPAVTAKPRRTDPAGFSEILLRKFVFPYDEAMLWSLDAKKAALAWSKEVSFAAIFSTFPPMNTHLAAWGVARSLGIPWIADFRDPLGEPGVRGEPGFQGWLNNRLERRIVKRAAAVLNVSNVLHEAAAARYPEHSHKLHLFWNGYDPAEDLSALPVKPGKTRVLLHAGNLYYGRRPTKLIDSLYRLIRNQRIDPSSVLVRLMGQTEPIIRKDQAAEFEYLEQAGVLRLEPALPRNEALIAMREAHGLLLIDMSYGYGFAVPAKLFEYVRTGRPILAFSDEHSPMNEILSRCGIAHRVVFHNSSAEHVDRQVLEYLLLPCEPTPPSEWFLNEFDGRRSAGKLARLLDDVIPGGRG